MEYQLEVITTEGVAYESDNVGVPDPSQITNVYAERVTTDLGVEGIQIYVDSEPISGNPSNFRYTYDETYKIIAPLWSPFDMVVLDPNPPYAFGLVPREQEERVCYATQHSNEIIQNEGVDLTGNMVVSLLVRFIPRDNFVISHRYSILVQQLGQSPDAFAFYQTLKELSSNTSVFTDVQPGFIEGNIANLDNP